MNGSVASLVRAALLAALLSGSAAAAHAEESYSPRSATRDPQNVYWGDTHLHTSLSVDSVGLGNASLGPDDAYRFAMGEVVRASNGMKARLNRPLDFLVIADHDVNMGVLTAIDAGDRGVLKTGVAKRWRAVEAEERRKGTFDPNNRQVVWETWAATPPQVVGDSEIRRSVWQEVTAVDHDSDVAFRLGRSRTTWALITLDPLRTFVIDRFGAEEFCVPVGAPSV